MMNFALQARVDMALARVFENIDADLSEDHRERAYEGAHSEGYHSEAISPYFHGEPLLLKGHRDGVEENRLLDEAAEQAAIDHEETQAMSGSEEEWNALSQKQQEGQRDGWSGL